MTKNVIVTGGCGYIGSHVARAFKLADETNTVGIIDRVVREHTLAGIDSFQLADFASDQALSNIVMEEPDVIVHCAGTSLVGPSMTNPGEYYDNNIAKTIKLLNVVKDLPKKPLIMFSSSASVYGIPEEFPIVEESPIHPISPYGNTKAITETILKDYAHAYGISSVVFRYFNAAGAMPLTHDLGQEPGATHIVARILEAAINDTDFTLYGSDYDTEDGTCVRDYVHVWDIAQAHVMAADYHGNADVPVSTEAGSTIYNLGTGKGVSNMEIIKYVTAKYGLNRLVVQNRRPGDPPRLVADHKLVKFMLGWSPVNSDIGNIIDSAYKWYMKKQVVDLVV
jgi:UDP-glucose-4-epimerase GalE